MSMKVNKVYAKDVFDDDNNGLLFGLEKKGNSPSYVEWFATEQEREETIKNCKLVVVN